MISLKVLDKEIIKESFSRAAAGYDAASDFQKETGRMLIDSILEDPGPKAMVLDAGMGTGSITRQLSVGIKRRVYGCDMAWGMAAFAAKNTKGLWIIQADTEDLPYKEGVFDIVFSNIACQWVHDLKKAFSDIKRVLKKEGRFYFSVLTKDSLRELYGTLAAVFGRDLGAGLLPEAGVVRRELRESGFNTMRCEEVIIKRHYTSALELLRNLKGMGANKVFGKNIFGMGGKRLFFEMISAYDKDFNENGRVFATYNVLLGRAKQ